MKKKVVIPFLVLGVTSLIVTICVVAPSVQNVDSVQVVYENAIYFNSSKNKLNTTESVDPSEATVKSEWGNNFIMNYNNVINGDDVWQTVNAGGSFYTTRKNVLNNNQFHYGAVIKLNFVTQNIPYKIYFSKDGTFSNNWCRSYTTTSDENEIYFEGHPNYFKFEAQEGAISIISMKVKYGCNQSVDEEWDKNHGAIPVISEDKKTLTYGLYPKSRVTDTNIIRSLEYIALTRGEEEYLWYNDEYYVKDESNPYNVGTEQTTTWEDGTIIPLNQKFYFKCEPLVWNIISSSEGVYTVDCSNIPYAKRMVYSSIAPYSDSELRGWLNNEFYNKAFFQNSSLIQATNFSEIGTESDKVWVGSKTEYETWYNDDASRKKRVTDFGLCNYLFLGNDRNGYYWTRTLDSGYSHIVYDSGSTTGSTHSNYAEYIGASPSLTLKIS